MATGSDTIYAHDAVTGEPFEPAFHCHNVQDLDEAVASAANAFTIYGRWSLTKRATLLRTIASEIESIGAQIQQCAHRETGLPLARLHGETARTCNQLRLFADMVLEGSWLDARIDRADTVRTPPKPDIRSLRAPLGPVAVFGAGNFPLAFSVAGGDTASALAAGCTVIVKAHPGHLGTSELVAGCIRRAVVQCGAPAGVFSLLTAGDHGFGLALVSHAGICAVGFTGSHKAGHAIMEAARLRKVPIPIYAEMGSVNPVVVLPDALATTAEALSQGLYGSVSLGVGQFCTKPGLVFLPKGEASRQFAALLASRIAGMEGGVMLSRDVRDNYVTGRQRMAGTPGVVTVASVDAPTGMAVFSCDSKTFGDHSHLQEEVFGPTVLLVTYADIEDLIAALGKLGGQLTASLHATAADLAAHEGLAETLASMAGRLIYNGFPTGVEVCPAMHHGGPYPATSDGQSTSVGTRAIERFTRVVCFQDWPPGRLPEALQDDNPWQIKRLVDGKYTHS